LGTGLNTGTKVHIINFLSFSIFKKNQHYFKIFFKILDFANLSLQVLGYFVCDLFAKKTVLPIQNSAEDLSTFGTIFVSYSPPLHNGEGLGEGSS